MNQILMNCVNSHTNIQCLIFLLMQIYCRSSHKKLLSSFDRIYSPLYSAFLEILMTLGSIITIWPKFENTTE